MKQRYYLLLFVLLFAFVQENIAQDDQPVRERRIRGTEAVAGQNTLPDLTERAKIKNEEATKGPGHVAWLREIYRTVDLEKDNNAALYYPIQPIGKRMNLFSLIFRLMSDNKITTYKYEDGVEIFTDQYKESFAEILTKYAVPYRTEGAGANAKYIVDDIDIPSSEVLAYMIKEAVYFDQATGSFSSQVIALCPMLIRMDYDSGIENRDPLFWVQYEDIKPYLSRELIMTSNFNNAMTYTMDDYFMKGMYTGEIIKTTNLMNESLAQQVSRKTAEMQASMPAIEEDIEVEDTTNGDDILISATVGEVKEVDYLKLAQDSIEQDLKKFEEGLWIYNDSIAKKIAEEQNQKGKKEKKQKTEKSSSPKSSGSSAKSSEKATPTKSVRRGNR